MPGPRARQWKKEGKKNKWCQFDDKTLLADKCAERSCSLNSAQDAAPEEPPHEEYFRRKLPSNWGRYKESEEDGSNINQKPGGDFEQLLSSTAGSDAHFRFKEEQDWEEDFEVNEFLSVNCKLLADALRTVSIPERLRLSADVFPPEIYKQYIDDASRCRYGGHQLQRNHASENVKDVPIKSVKKEAESKAAVDRLTSSLAACLTLRTSDKGHAHEISVSNSAEDELDFLLSLSKRSEETKQQKAEAEEAQPKMLQVPPRCGSGALSTTSPTPKKLSLNLEDWLDRVLDD